MAKIRIDKTVEVCDLCGREGCLTTCIGCGKRYCLIDDCTIPGCMVSPPCCKDCGGNQAIIDVCERYGKLIADRVKDRDIAIAKMMKQKKPKRK